MKIFTLTVFCLDFPISSADPDQMPCLAASDLGLHCLHNKLKRVYGLKRVNVALWDNTGQFSKVNGTSHKYLIQLDGQHNLILLN